MSQEPTLITRKGSFKCISRAADVFSVLLIVGVFIMAAILVLSFFNFGSEINDLIMMCGALCFVVEGSLAAVRVLLSLGREYDYEAGEKDITITAPDGSKEYFYYSDVSEVSYTPIHKKNRLVGYVTEITTSTRKVVYRFYFGINAENTSTAATPFYILEVNSRLREPENEEKNSRKIMEEFERMQLHQSVAVKKTPRAVRESKLWDSVQAEKLRSAEADIPDDIGENSDDD